MKYNYDIINTANNTIKMPKSYFLRDVIIFNSVFNHEIDMISFNVKQILIELKNEEWYYQNTNHLLQQILENLTFSLIHNQYYKISEDIIIIFRFIVKHTKDLTSIVWNHNNMAFGVLSYIQYTMSSGKQNNNQKILILMESELIKEIGFRHKLRFLEFARRINITNPVFNDRDLVREIVKFI